MISVPTPRIPELDSLRAILALVVVFHHVFKIFRAEVETILSSGAFWLADLVQAQNYRAVMAFFALSGFTIALATQKFPPINGTATRHYLRRRATRIFPLYYITLAWTAVLGLVYGINHPDFSLRSLAGNALFLQTSASGKGNWFPPYGLNGPLWSLSYEVFYYLALPLVLRILARPGPWLKHPKAMFILLGLGAMVAGLGAGTIAPSPFSAFATLWIVWIVGYVSFGMLPSKSNLALVAFPAFLTVTAEALLAQAGHISASLSGAREGTVIALAFAALAIWRRWIDAPFIKQFRWLLNAMFERIGRGSYALYLLHYPLLLAMQAVLVEATQGAGALIAAGVLFMLFILLFCPWIEGTLGRFFQSRGAVGSEISEAVCASRSSVPD